MGLEREPITPKNGNGEAVQEARELQDTPLLDVTENARRKVLQFRAGQPDEVSLALWLEVSGANGLEYTYDMYLQPIEAAGENDVVQHHDDIAIVVPAQSVERLRGAKVDLVGDLVVGHLKVENPNSPSPAVGTGTAGTIDGDLEQQVAHILEHHVNPAIASHGGRADLDRVEGTTAFLRLSGGCQGCGMAKVTLSQGIEAAIKQSVPEITDVVDVTDHASGSNPYYQPTH